jgi:MFS family permease
VANQFAGPLLGSLLFTVAVATPFLTDAGTYLIAALLVALIPGNYRASRTASGSEGVTGIGHDVAEGLRWLWRHRLLRTLAIALGAANLASGAMGVMVLFAQDVLGVDESRYGLLLATYAVGGVAGSMLANPIAGRLGAGQAMLGSMAVLGAGLVAVGLLSSAWLVGAVNVSFGAATVVWNVLTVSLRQSVIPDDILGRVNSAYRFVSWGATPVGFLAGGLLADGFGLRAPFLAGGLVVLGLVALMAPVVNNHSVEAALRTEEIE